MTNKDNSTFLSTEKQQRHEEYEKYILPILKILHGKTVQEAKELLTVVNTYASVAGGKAVISSENTKELYASPAVASP